LGMVPVMRGPAVSLAKWMDPDAQTPLKVLDIAAGHGLFGIAFGVRCAIWKAASKRLFCLTKREAKDIA
ncbi:MAG: hypothetical protein O7G87_14330, partial [bacterium]|nr:hypothetical protein [bacterium]